jgi:hypothetical protein
VSGKPPMQVTVGPGFDEQPIQNSVVLQYAKADPALFRLVQVKRESLEDSVSLGEGVTKV